MNTRVDNPGFPEYESQLEDLQDLALIAERRDEPKLSLEDFEKELRSRC